MKTGGWLITALIIFISAGMFACGSDDSIEEDVLSRPKTYIGSEQCKICHLEHYDSWKTTLHSRSIQDVNINRDAIITDINPVVIKADLEKMEEELKIPINEVYIPKIEEIKFTIGIQWKQRFIIEKSGRLYVAPVEYNAWTNSWSSYRAEDWQKRPWTEKCGGCHVTGLNLKTGKFIELGVGCESCHGPGSHHVALPKKAIFDKRLTIINPSKLPTGIRTQICGSCHSNGQSTKVKNVDWPVDYQPGRALGPYFEPVGKAGQSEADLSDSGHHREYDEWKDSVHGEQGVSCTSCHYVHQLGVSPTQYQTKGSGSQQCLMCHTIINENYSHSIHSFANCIGCHMPRTSKSSALGSAISHEFKFQYPAASIKAGGVDKQPNACSTCHHHENTPLEELDGFVEAVKRNQMPKPFIVHKGLEQTEN